MSYKYISPLEQGCIKIKLTKEEHRKIFGRYNKFLRYEYYENQNYFKYEAYTKVVTKLLICLLYPATLIYEGLQNFHEANQEISDLFHERKRGHFYSECAWKKFLIKRGVKFTDYFKKGVHND